MNPTIGLSEYFCTHSNAESGNSYSSLSAAEIVKLVSDHWQDRKSGDGEAPGDLSRKVLVPVPVSVTCWAGEHPDDWQPQITSQFATRPVFFLPPRIKLQVGLPIKAEIKVRQTGEDPYIETYVEYEDAKKFGYEDIPACYCDVVCYSAEALLENNGNRTTQCDWEIITLLCRAESANEPMAPLVMARNFLEKPGGTKGEYTAKQFAEAIYHHSNRSVRVRKGIAS